ncbi:MAG: glutamine--fructose-6-phosphate transaminase (isomerizing) [Nanohaloarchaea archaeon]|nr:glutamine--fructose-6-phosphate transaminase (isomerizing) [Candidatus Nanohaloarchaea archaeon]
MCGIVGYNGENASEKILEGLQRLEYRGYDSAGIATLSEQIEVVKAEGEVDEAITELPSGNTGIGHTRWATHGGVNDRNAHPHTDCKNKVAVVHNGIIQNHEQLKEELEDHKFRSETDTEVIPHLIEEALKEGLEAREICEMLQEKLEGEYAIVALLESGEMIALRKGSPLVIGVGDGENFLGSDVTAFIQHTDQAIFMQNGDYATINEGIDIYKSGEKVEREIEKVDWDAQQASKNGYDHFMLKEIEQQPKTVKRAAFQDRKDMEEAKKLIENSRKVVLTGCGTSSYAASIAAKYFREAGIEVVYEQSHEIEYRSKEFSEKDLVIALSQSGETADLLSFLEKIDSRVLGIVNVVGSTLDRHSDKSLYVNAGPEIGVASTKAFTGQLTVMKLLKYTLEDKLEEGRDSLTETAEKIEEVVETNKKSIEELSEELKDKDNVYFVGRYRGVDVAREAALKLKELSYIHAEAFPGGEFKHGTLALVEDDTPVVGFVKDRGMEEVISNIVEAKSRGASITGVGESLEGFEHFIEIPEDKNREILEVVPFQLLAYRTAVKLGHNPDKPRNLAKSVTVK